MDHTRAMIEVMDTISATIKLDDQYKNKEVSRWWWDNMIDCFVIQFKDGTGICIDYDEVLDCILERKETT